MPSGPGVFAGMRFRYLMLPAIALAASGLAKEPERIPGMRLAQPPTIDGRVDPEEWKGGATFEGLSDAATGAEYPQKSQFWIGYDREFVYFAARFEEKDPKAVRATEYRTNVSLSGDDYVELDLDLFGSSDFSRFQMNAQGASNISIAGGRAAKREWLGAILAKGRITESGWEAEARIPWNAMDIPAGGRRNIRFNVQRFVSSTARKLTWRYVPMTDAGATPTWTGVELPKPTVDRSVKLLPYGYAGYDPKVGGVFNSGFDMKTSLADQVKFVGSVNPDFRNIENQILSLDFSRFERLAGETRPFFQEGSEYSNSQLFASQRIRGFDAGINTFGRISDKLSFSLIDTVDFGHTNSTIFNLTNNPNPNTSVRMSFTDLEKSDLSNQAYLFRVSQNFGDYNLFLRDMASKDSVTGYGRQLDANLTYVKNGLAISGGYTHADPHFRPRLGFVQEVDVKGPFLAMEYNKAFNKGAIKDWHVEGVWLSYDHVDDSFYRKEWGGSANTTLANGLNIAVGADLADFEGSKDSLYLVRLTFPRGNPYKNVQLGFDTGRQAGFSYRNMQIRSAYRLGKRLQLTLRGQHIDYNGKSDQVIVGLNYDLGKDRAVSGRLVRQNGKTNGYIAFQRSGNAGMEYFFIVGDPNAEQFRSSVILKVVFPITLGGRNLPKGAHADTVTRISG